jgi:hypothetical protein
LRIYFNDPEGIIRCTHDPINSELQIKAEIADAILQSLRLTKKQKRALFFARLSLAYCFYLLVIPKGFVPLSVAQIHNVRLSQKVSTFGGHFFLFKNLIEANFRGP